MRAIAYAWISRAAPDFTQQAWTAACAACASPVRRGSGYAERVDPEIEARRGRGGETFESLGAIGRAGRPRPGRRPDRRLEHASGGRAWRCSCRRSATAASELADPGCGRRAAQGGTTLATDYIRAQLEARRAAQRVRRASTRRFDLLLTPSLPLPAFEVGRSGAAAQASGARRGATGRPSATPSTSRQQPAASVPCGLHRQRACPSACRSSDPIGADDRVLRASRAFETDGAVQSCWTHRAPALCRVHGVHLILERDHSIVSARDLWRLSSLARLSQAHTIPHLCATRRHMKGQRCAACCSAPLLIHACCWPSGWQAAVGACSAPRGDLVKADLLAEPRRIAPGQTFWVGVRLRIKQHWHVYWRNPGDSGEAVSITWRLPPGFTASPIALADTAAHPRRPISSTSATRARRRCSHAITASGRARLVPQPIDILRRRHLAGVREGVHPGRSAACRSACPLPALAQPPQPAATATASFDAARRPPAATLALGRRSMQLAPDRVTLAVDAKGLTPGPSARPSSSPTRRRWSRHAAPQTARGQPRRPGPAPRAQRAVDRHA